MTKVELYEPHPGEGGAAVPLPKIMKDAAKELDGKVMTLDDIIKQLSPVAEKAGGQVGVQEEFQYIKFWVEPPVSNPYAMHMWRLIRYR